MATIETMSSIQKTFLFGIGISLVVFAEAHAGPQAGESFPSFVATDVTGQSHRSEEFMGHGTLVVAITDRDAADAMRAWYLTADERAPKTVRRLTILSFELPFFISLATAQSKARAQIPERFWHDSLLDKDGTMAKLLGMEKSETPYVFAVDPSGKILTSFQGMVTAPGADAIWTSLSNVSR